MYPHLLTALESLYAFLFVYLREVHLMSIGNRGVDKILAAYHRAQRVKERALESPMPASSSPYRSTRQKPPTLSLSHAISVRAKWTRVAYRWWRNRPEHSRRIVKHLDYLALLYGWITDTWWVWKVVFAMFAIHVFFAWLEGRSILRGRVLERRARMHKSLSFKAFWQSAPVISQAS